VRSGKRLHRVVAITVAVACGGCLQAAPEALWTRTLLATRNGQEIGTETIAIERRPEHLRVSLAVHLQVKMLGMTVYRFDQDSTETWSGDELEELSSQTSDNGVKHSVQVHRDGATLDLRADLASSSVAQTSLSGSQWYEPHFESATLIHNVDGRLLHVTARKLGTETIRVGAVQIETRHYRFSGDVSDDFWFDTEGLLVQRRLVAHDHSVVQFTLAPGMNVAAPSSGERPLR
jgi:Family of unknown function (DUF6134)